MIAHLKTVAAATALVALVGFGIRGLVPTPVATVPFAPHSEYTYDIDTEDARFGDFSGWSGELDAEDALHGLPATGGGGAVSLIPASAEDSLGGCILPGGRGDV